MKFSLIKIYMRPKPFALIKLQSVRKQSLYPDKILIIDGLYR
jgi:hypothetical protein